MIVNLKYSKRFAKSAQNAVKLFFLFAVFAFLWNEIAYSKQTYSLLSVTGNPAAMLMLTIVMCAVPLNWYIESVKWRCLMNTPDFAFSSADAFKSTLAGAAASTLLPNRIGESIGRVFWLPDHLKLPGAVQSGLAGISQLCITLAGGALILPFYLIYYTNSEPLLVLALSFTASIITACGFYLLFNLSKIKLPAQGKIPFRGRLQTCQKALRQTQPDTLKKLLILSALRYLVFSIQFAVVLTVFVNTLSFIPALAAVAVIYLVTTLVPSFTLAELGIRESAAVLLMAPLSAQSAAVITATFLIWCVNIALPSLFGLYFVTVRKNLLTRAV